MDKGRNHTGRMDIVDKLGLGDNTFLGRYIGYCTNLTDAPKVFHLATGLTALAACCGSEVAYPGFGGRTCWPNLYTLLISPSGLFRKSTALGIAQDLVTEVDRDLLVASEATRERFLGNLKDHPSAFYPIPEFGAMLSLWQREYMAGMREIVTDLYDPHSEYTRQTQKDKILIKKPALNILAASTVDWLREKLTEGDLRGGLMGRFLLFPGVHKEGSKGLVLDNHGGEREELVKFLKSIHVLDRSWVDVSRVRDPFNTWLQSIEAQLETNVNPELIGFQSRIGSHCIKLLVLLTVSKYGPQPKYEPDASELAQAAMLSYWLMEQAGQLAMTGFTKNRTELQAQKFLQMAGRNGGIDRSTCLKNLHLTSKEFDALVTTLVDRAEIKKVREKHDKAVVTIYQLNRDDFAK